MASESKWELIAADVAAAVRAMRSGSTFWTTFATVERYDVGPFEDRPMPACFIMEGDDNDAGGSPYEFTIRERDVWFELWLEAGDGASEDAKAEALATRLNRLVKDVTTCMYANRQWNGRAQDTRLKTISRPFLSNVTMEQPAAAGIRVSFGITYRWSDAAALA